jgi:adenosylcobinamide-phosphate guanylyltransferase
MIALIMAGGRGSRMKLREEKPLIKVNGKQMIEHVIDALKGSSRVNEIVVLVSRYTPKTARRTKTLPVKIVETPGKGYVADVHYAVKKLKLGKVLVISADLPLISSKVIDEVIASYEESGKPALSVMCPVEVFERLGFKPEYTFLVGNRIVSTVGVNIIDGSMIDDGEMDEKKLIFDDEELALNINTVEDVEIVERVAHGGLNP